MQNFNSYLSPFSWRYGSEEMRQIWSETNKRLLWRKIWAVLAAVQVDYGLVTPEQARDLEQHVDQINISRALEIESKIHHDLMAEIKTFAEQCPMGGGIIHLGATSMDIEDNADALRMRQSVDLLIVKLGRLLAIFAERLRQWAEVPIIAFTHLQPAEPSTLGYRFALYAQDLLNDFEILCRLQSTIKGKGFKGAVGTAAAYQDLLGIENYPMFEQKMSAALNLPFYPVSSQTYPRKQDYDLLSALAGLGATINKMAFDLRILQSPPIGETAEPFGAQQVGSSAMPFKRNPIQAEKINSLARMLAGMPQVAWGNAAHSLLERTLDDSANRRTILPEAFILTDELLQTSTRLIRDLRIDQTAIKRNLATYAPFAATERVLMAFVRAGGDRQHGHEILRELAMTAWSQICVGGSNPLQELVINHPEICALLSKPQITDCFDLNAYTGIAPQRTMELAEQIDRKLAKL